MWRFSPNGEGIHLRLLQMLLGAGYDCSADGFYHAAPNETCISGAYLGYFKNHRCDHFLLEFQRICSHNCYGKLWSFDREIMRGSFRLPFRSRGLGPNTSDGQHSLRVERTSIPYCRLFQLARWPELPRSNSRALCCSQTRYSFETTASIPGF